MSSLRTGRRMPGLRQRGSRSGKHPVHPSTSPRIGPRRRRQSRRTESKTLDGPKQTANWGRSIKSFHEEMGTGGQCSICECGVACCGIQACVVSGKVDNVHHIRELYN